MSEFLPLDTLTGKVRGTSSSVGTAPKPIDFSDVSVIGLDIGGGAQSGTQSLISGQSYVDVVFLIAQLSSTWTFIGCQVYNTIDPDPLNIWPGIVTAKSATGFTVQLNGVPDSDNYRFQWMIQNAVPLVGQATAYLLSGPVRGPISAPSTFLVSLNSGEFVTDPVVVTPSDGGAGGTFTPAYVELTTEESSVSFTYTPASYGDKTLTVINDSGLTDPAGLAFNSHAATYTLSGPSGGDIFVESTDFTVALPVGATVPWTVIVTPSFGGLEAGTFDPETVSLTTGAPSDTFTFTPAIGGDTEIITTNNRGLTDPAGLIYDVIGPALLDTLISYWALDEASGTRNDSHGTNHLTAAGSPVGATGIINNGCQLVAASSQYMAVLDNSSLRVTSDFTWSVWAKLTTNATNMSVLTKDEGPSTGFRDYGIFYHPAVGYFFCVNNPATIAIAVGSPTSTGVWTHIVVWWDSADSKLRIRINDTTTYTSSMTGALTQTVSHLRVGAVNDTGGAGISSFYDGILDEIGFWKRLLTADEITQLYNGGAGLPYSSFTL